MARTTSLDSRLRIYLRREAYVWVCKRGERRVHFGWILNYRRDENVLFKDDELRSTVRIGINDIEGCGVL